MTLKNKNCRSGSGSHMTARRNLESQLNDIEREIVSGAPASRISQGIAKLRIASLSRIMRIQAQLDEGRELEAAGNPSGRARIRSLRFALDDESRVASLLDRGLKGLRQHLNLELRCRLEEEAKVNTPAREKSEEEMQNEVLEKVFSMIVAKARIFPIPLPSEVKEAAASMGIKLAGDAVKHPEP
jgi:hypothetical protein